MAKKYLPAIENLRRNLERLATEEAKEKGFKGL